MLESYFKFTERKTTLYNEVNAGLVMYRSTTYILLLNPMLLSQLHHIEYNTAYTATILCSTVATLFSGIFGNLPFAFLPGLGVTSYVASTSAQTLNTSTILAVILLTGVLMLLFSVCALNEYISYIIPVHIKTSTIIGISLLLALIALQQIGILHTDYYHNIVLSSWTDWHHVDIYFCFATLILMCTLLHYNYNSYVLISITISTILYCITVHNPMPAIPFSLPTLHTYINDIIFHLHYDSSSIVLLLTLLIVCIVDLAGVVHGLGFEAQLNKNGSMHIENESYAYAATAIGTIIAALFGCTPVIAAVESAAGLKSGGRTGISAIVCSICYLLSLVLLPLIEAIPLSITSTALIMTAALMCYQLQTIDWYSPDVALSSFLTIILIPLKQSIAFGIVVGIITYSVVHVATRWSRNNTANTVEWTDSEPEFALQHSTLHRQATAPTTYRTIGHELTKQSKSSTYGTVIEHDHDFEQEEEKV